MFPWNRFVDAFYADIHVVGSALFRPATKSEGKIPDHDLPIFFDKLCQRSFRLHPLRESARLKIEEWSSPKSVKFPRSPPSYKTDYCTNHVVPNCFLCGRHKLRGWWWVWKRPFRRGWWICDESKWRNRGHARGASKVRVKLYCDGVDIRSVYCSCEKNFGNRRRARKILIMGTVLWLRRRRMKWWICARSWNLYYLRMDLIL